MDLNLRRHHGFMWSFTKSLLASFRRPVFAYLITLSFTLIGACSGLILVLEREANPNIKDPLEALYYTVTVMTGVGLGDIAPITTAGRVLSMMMMLLGTAVFVCFTAALSASILEIELRHRSMTKDGVSDEAS